MADEDQVMRGKIKSVNTIYNGLHGQTGYIELINRGGFKYKMILDTPVGTTTEVWLLEREIEFE